MPEVRQAIPSISQLKYTVCPVERWDDTGLQNQKGQALLQKGFDLPGVVVVVTPYFNNIAMPQEVYSFQSKKFLQAGLYELKEIESPNDVVLQTIERTEAKILDQSSLWLEDIESAINVDNLEDAFATAYSDLLDEFPQLREPESPIAGLSYYARLVQWDARLPWTGEQCIKVKTGFFANPEFTGSATLEEVKFESGQSKRDREARLQFIANEIAALSSDITTLERIMELKEVEQTPEVLAELATLKPEFVNDPNIENILTDKKNVLEAYQTESAQLESVTYGDLAEFMENPSVSSIASALTVAIFSVLKLKNNRWANLDLQAVLERYALPNVS